MTTVSVDIDLIDYIEDFDTGDLIEELENRGYFVSETEVSDELTKDDLFLLIGLLDDCKPGSQESFIRYKLLYILDQKRAVDGR